MTMKVSDRVYCRIGEDGDSNNGFIICDDCCIVVDTATFPDQTREDLKNLKKVTQKEIKFLINTHCHGDHTLGNMYFSDIIAHKSCYQTLKERISFYMGYIKQDEENKKRFEGLTIKLPTITFSDEISLHLASEIVLTHYGGHTAGSSTVYIPEDKVLFSGDLLFVGSHPYLGDADIQQWIVALKELLKLDIQSIVPGHGELCDKEEFKTHITYLQTFYDNLKDLKQKYSKEKICENIDLMQLPDLGKKERIVRNVEAQYDKI
ncbi:MAG: hypothetical protein AYK18_07575 [Theionarchaea archaeon DG-70]|nr:MAG: hypothetical protein AYK18_07575 [Theionarchaea archaeon DG-70]